MAKKNSKASKESKKTLATKTTTATKKNVEEVKVEEVKVEEPEKTPEAPKPELPHNPEPIVPEVVEPVKPEKDEKPVPSIAAGLAAAANGDRLDHNHAVELMKMIHEGYVTNPSAPAELGKAMKQQFDAMAVVELMFYNQQLENDLQQLGLKVNKNQFVQIETIARQMFGITLKGLPDKTDPNQLVINFSESVPQPVKEQVKKDLAAAKSMPEIPQPDPKMPEKEKYEVLKSIFSKIGGGIGNNINSAIEWSRKAFSFSDTEKRAVILASILRHDFRTTITNGMSNMAKGKLSHDHSIFGVHAVLHQWLPTYSEQEIAEIAQVCLAYKEESNCKDYTEKTGQKLDLDNSLALINRDIIASCADKVIDGILKNKEQVVVDYADKTGKLAVNTAAIRKTMIAVYGENEELLKDTIKNIAQYYVKPIMRLSKYIDKSAYSTAIA